MSKRERQEEEGDRPPKRARAEHQPAQVFEVEYARDLQRYLVFRQDGEQQQLLNGIASFKAFLESILYHKEEENRGRQISILREYLDSQKPDDPKDTERPFLSQLWQAWSFANQNNKDYLASTICAVLSLLLKTLSGILDFREHGLLLCRTILQHQHIRLVKRCLDGPKHKDFIISPSLRLLIEVTTFDGGVLAREVYKRREQTFDTSTIRRNLGLVKFDVPDEEARKRPSVRILTVRYVVALFKHLHEGGKIDILKSKPLCTALFQFVSNDPADLVAELLATVEQNVLKDESVPRTTKAALLTPQTLERVTAIATCSNEDHAAADRAFQWLRSVCSKESYGVLRSAGWYPPGTTEDRSNRSDESIDLGLESLGFYDRDEMINIRNTTLLSYVNTLRAHSEQRERELLLVCFASAPELVAAYFANSKLQLDPKLSNTWIGYASLMFEIVAQDVPSKFGEGGGSLQLPPQSVIMIESVLPKPLTLQVLNRCLSQDEDLVTFFAVRILVVAVQKLNSILAQLRQHQDSGLWQEAGERLVQRFIERAPKLKDIFAVFRKMPDDGQHAMQREAITRLMQLYYEVIPVQALEDPIDISNALTAALIRSEEPVTNSHDETSGLRKLELEHLLSIAGLSTGMRWFHKQGGLTFTPIVTLLRLHRKEVTSLGTRTLLQDVLTENGILNSDIEDEQQSPFDALLASVLDLEDDSLVWHFIDDCIGRATRKPVKYVDDLEELSEDSTEEKAEQLPSVLAAVVLEQAPFAAAKSNEQGKAEGSWLLLFLETLRLTSDKGGILKTVVRSATKIVGKEAKVRKEQASLSLQKLRDALPTKAAPPSDEQSTTAPETVALTFSPPPAERSNHPELYRWSQKDIDLAIEDGDISALVLCLCSQHNDIRRQALIQLNKIKLLIRPTAPLDPETLSSDHAHISLLIGELTETFELHYLPHADLPLPYLAGTFASRALAIQFQPSHFLYAKLNHFLIRGAKWDIKRLPRYWIEHTFLAEPEDDDAYWKEVQWVLDWLVDGLRTRQDLEVLRKGDQRKGAAKKPEVMEMVLAMWTSVGAKRIKAIRERIAELVFRAGCVEGGSDVLVTRSGVLSWLDMVAEEEAGGSGVVAGLKEKLSQTCDKERIGVWKGLKVLAA
ncbi:Putative nucleolar pre-ribosomal-associated protein [Septoria linicola]|uniref:Nucleolar pre-ribosomal-associated protein n=1 Tax=Septoria linicola TaxID=215465 RepID=A0A9Q9EPX6_9PEZI|nr:Putative nucleolar pre-ribosomal-associated protein [Septoria linicola]